MKKIFVFIALLSFVCLGIGSAYALDTKYNNKMVYDQTWFVESGYDNQIPYAAFFVEFAPVPETIKVQQSTKMGRVIQAEIPIHQKEERIGGKNFKKVKGLE